MRTAPLTAPPVNVATGLEHMMLVSVVVNTEVTAVQDMFPAMADDDDDNNVVLVAVPEVKVVVREVEAGMPVAEGTVAEMVTPTVRQIFWPNWRAAGKGGKNPR